MADPVDKPYFLAVEGQDEVHFFAALFKYLAIANVDVEEVGGVEKFGLRLPALVRRSGFAEVRSLGIVRDADTSAESAFQSICNILRCEGLKVPRAMATFSDGTPKVGVFVMPDNAAGGMLEDLCLASVAGHQVMPCVDSFIGCASKTYQTPSNVAKTRAQVFLAVMPKLVTSVGLGAEKGYWDFTSEYMAVLVRFCQELVTETQTQERPS